MNSSPNSAGGGTLTEAAHPVDDDGAAAAAPVVKKGGARPAVVKKAAPAAKAPKAKKAKKDKKAKDASERMLTDPSKCTHPTNKAKVEAVRKLRVGQELKYYGRNEKFDGKAGTVVGFERAKKGAGVYVDIGDDRFMCSPLSLHPKGAARPEPEKKEKKAKAEKK